MKQIVVFFVLTMLLSGCEALDKLKNMVEVNYDVDFDPQTDETAVVSYYNNKGELITENIVPGEWSYKAIFNDGDKTGVWVETEAEKGYVSVYLTAWYSELNDLEDYVGADTWVLPINEKKGLEHVLTLDKCYDVSYEVLVDGTNGKEVTITYSDESSDNNTAQLKNGRWAYRGCFTSDDYASVFVTSEAQTGTAILTINIDYDDRDDVIETMTVDFSSATKNGGIGKPIEP